MTGTTRIEPAPITGVFGVIVKRFSMKLLGEVPEPIGIYFHNRPVLRTFLAVGSKAQKWSACDRISRIYAVRNPRKLRRLDDQAQLTR